MPKGYNPEDCANPVCGSKMDMFGKALGAARAKSTVAGGGGGGKAALECPVDREELGRGTWDLLHTTAAYYPETPSATDKAAGEGLVLGYPCEHCREDLVETVKESPPALGSRTAFALWVCAQHNLVNEKLGKKAFPCDMTALDERWKTGAKGCWTNAGETASASLGRDVGGEGGAPSAS